MIYTKNNLEVVNQDWTEGRTYNLDLGQYANKISIQLLAADRKENFKYGPVIVQVTEGEEHTYEDELNTQQFLELGFNSRSFITPITGFRLRVPRLEDGIGEVKPALLHFVFYG